MLMSCLLQGELNSGKSRACGARYLAAEHQWNVSICPHCEAFCLVLANVFAQAVQTNIVLLFTFCLFI